MSEEHNNSDIDIDIESPFVDQVEEEEEPTTPVPTTAKPAVTESLSKETRKLRKKKVLDSDDEEKVAKPDAVRVSKSPEKEDMNEQDFADLFMNYNSLTDHQIDHIDTDDLMDELDRLPPLRKALVNKKKKKVTDRKSRASAKKLAIVKSEIISKVCTKTLCTHVQNNFFFFFY